MKRMVVRMMLGLVLGGSAVTSPGQDLFAYSGGNGGPLTLTLNSDLQFTLSEAVTVPYGIGFSITNAFSSPQASGGYVINILSGLNLSDSMGELTISMENVGVPLPPSAPDNTAGLNNTTFYLFFQFPTAPESLPAGDVITLTAGTATTAGAVPFPTPVLPPAATVVVHDGMADQLPGITGVTPVPEPSTAALSLLGGLAGWIRFQRRR